MDVKLKSTAGAERVQAVKKTAGSTIGVCLGGPVDSHGSIRSYLA
jgi:hypothetical protein